MLEKVRTLKEEMGISYKHMAEKAGINYSTFRKYVSGHSNLNQENQEKLKEYLSQFQRAQGQRNLLRLYTDEEDFVVHETARLGAQEEWVSIFLTLIYIRVQKNDTHTAQRQA